MAIWEEKNRILCEERLKIIVVSASSKREKKGRGEKSRRRQKKKSRYRYYEEGQSRRGEKVGRAQRTRNQKKRLIFTNTGTREAWVKGEERSRYFSAEGDILKRKKTSICGRSELSGGGGVLIRKMVGNEPQRSGGKEKGKTEILRADGSSKEKKKEDPTNKGEKVSIEEF